MYQLRFDKPGVIRVYKLEGKHEAFIGECKTIKDADDFVNKLFETIKNDKN